MPILQEIQTRKKHRTLWITLTVLVLCGGVGYAGYVFYYKQTVDPLAGYTTHTVGRGDIHTSIESDGKVLYKDVYNINFPVDGTLREVLKKKGGMVKKGEILARLDETSARTALERAEIAVRSAEANLQARKTGKTSPEDIKLSTEQVSSSVSAYETMKAQMKTEVDSAKKSLESTLLSRDTAKTELQNTEETIRKELASAKLSVDANEADYQASASLLERIRSEENEKRENIRQRIVSGIDANLTTISQSIYDADIFLGVTNANRAKNDAFEMYISAKNTSLKTTAENALRDTIASFEDFENRWATIKSEKWLDPTREAGGENIQLLVSMIDTLSKITEALRNSVSSSTFPETVIASYITSFQSSIAVLQSEKLSLLELNQSFDTEETIMKNRLLSQQDVITATTSKLDLAKNALDRTIALGNTSLLSARSKLELAIKQYETAQKQYDNVRLTALSNIENAKKQIDIANAALDLKKEPASADELRPLQIAIESAKKDLQDAKKRLADMTLVSPTDGVVSEINGLAGEVVISPTTKSFMTIVDISHPYIEAHIEELDISKVRLGQSTLITFDSIEKTSFTGSVRFVSDTSSIDENDIVTYLVEIVFDPGQSGVREGMTATIDYIIDETKNTLTVPAGAIETIDGKTSVFSLRDNRYKEVAPGISDGKNTAIRSWVDEWETVRVKVQE